MPQGFLRNAKGCSSTLHHHPAIRDSDMKHIARIIQLAVLSFAVSAILSASTNDKTVLGEAVMSLRRFEGFR